MVKKIQIIAIIGIIVVLLAFFIYSGKSITNQSELMTKKSTNVSTSMCWDSVNQTCGGSCSSQADCKAGYICISRECPFAAK